MRFYLRGIKKKQSQAKQTPLWSNSMQRTDLEQRTCEYVEAKCQISLNYNQSLIKTHFPLVGFIAKLQKHTSPLDPKLQSYKGGPTNNCNNYKTENASRHIFPRFLSIRRWKDLSCCFLLLHYLLLCGTLLAGFILDFAVWFLGKPLKWVSDSKQSSACFLSIAPVASSLMWKKKRLSKERATLWSQNPFNTVLRNKDVVLVSWLTWKKNGACFFWVISLISIISAVWMNFRCLAWSYLCCFRSNTSSFMCYIGED